MKKISTIIGAAIFGVLVAPASAQVAPKNHGAVVSQTARTTGDGQAVSQVARTNGMKRSASPVVVVPVSPPVLAPLPAPRPLRLRDVNGDGVINGVDRELLMAERKALKIDSRAVRQLDKVEQKADKQTAKILNRQDRQLQKVEKKVLKKGGQG